MLSNLLKLLAPSAFLATALLLAPTFAVPDGEIGDGDYTPTTGWNRRKDCVTKPNGSCKCEDALNVKCKTWIPTGGTSWVCESRDSNNNVVNTCP